MQSSYIQTYTSYSGADIVATVTPVGGAPTVVGELQTISYSIHREKFPVRTLGRINPKGHTSGGRTIAGSLIFTVFDQHLLMDIIDKMKGDKYGITEDDVAEMKSNMKMDELPPIDVTITLNNELGNQSVITIYGITFVDEGQVMSIEDMITEQTMSYMALDIDVIRSVKRIEKSTINSNGFDSTNWDPNSLNANTNGYSDRGFDPSGWNSNSLNDNRTGYM